MIIRLMELKDLPIVLKLEESLYKSPWTEKMFMDELTENKFAYLFVLCNENYILGYYGMWIVNDYATITKVSICKELQGKKLSNILMVDLINRCIDADASVIDLEVRVSNEPAKKLYEKYGFKNVGIRKGYYNDGEDAIVMVKTLKEGEHFERIHIGN